MPLGRWYPTVTHAVTALTGDTGPGLIYNPAGGYNQTETFYVGYNTQGAFVPGWDIAKVALIRKGSATHSFDMDQRMVYLDMVATGYTYVQVKTPPTRFVAPPGEYTVFLLAEYQGEGSVHPYVPSAGRNFASLYE